MTGTALTRAEIQVAMDRIRPHVRLTPIIEVGLPGSAARVVLKLEQLQHTGSFKVRGVFNSLLSQTIPEMGVATASGGNHGAALAYAAAKLGVPCTVFLPTLAPTAKRRLVEQHGATVIVAGEVYAEAAQACAEYVDATGALDVPAFDSAAVMAGQGTVAVEVEHQEPGATVVLGAVGGGGFLGGVAAWYAGRAHLIGVEPDQAPSMYAARAAGRPVDVATAGVAADSLGCRRVGRLAFEVVHRHVQDLVLVTDDDIRQAQRWLWGECRLVAEPGGATALAAALARRPSFTSADVVVIIVCGANITDEPGVMVP